MQNLIHTEDGIPPNLQYIRDTSVDNLSPHQKCCIHRKVLSVIEDSLLESRIFHHSDTDANDTQGRCIRATSIPPKCFHTRHVHICILGMTTCLIRFCSCFSLHLLCLAFVFGCFLVASSSHHHLRKLHTAPYLNFP